MTCLICKQGETLPGVTTVTLQRGECTIIVKGVPASVCNNCQEYYLDEETAARVYGLAEAAINSGAEVEIRRYAA